MKIVVDSYKPIDPRELSHKDRFLGHRESRGNVTAGDKRCDYCGKWFSWSSQNIEKYIVERRWDFRRKDVIHCGSSHCWDYHVRWLKHVRKMNTDVHYVENNFIERKKREGLQEIDAIKLFNTLKEKGMVA